MQHLFGDPTLLGFSVIVFGLTPVPTPSVHGG